MVGDIGNINGIDPTFWVFKLDSNGNIPNCSIAANANATTEILSISAYDTTATVQETAAIITETTTSPQNTTTEPSWACCYTNEDFDCDGVANNSEEQLTNSMSNISFLADGDNCNFTPNGPYLGTCTQGNRGNNCLDDESCGVDGICSMNQEDNYPPQGNDIGDAFDCEGNFDCDEDCDGTDAATFKVDFGRSTFDNPCEEGDPCNGDFDCDGDCDGTDAAGFKSDFGRSSFNNPCPACTIGDWCSY